MGPLIKQNQQTKGFINEDNFPVNIVICQEPLESVYQVDPRPFARGKFAQVKRCLHRQTGIEYAGKSIKKRRRSTDVRHEIMHEIGVLLLSQNNNGIVRLHEVYETPTEFILILEMVKGGELQRVLDEEDTVPEKDVIRLLRQILKALQFLHSNNIAHLDIKPQNLLLTGPLPDGEVKLCDFGISRLITEGVELREIVGTPDYVAPEILHYEAIRLETDMWSIGVLTYVLLTGYSPFSGETKQETYSNITNSKLEFGPEFEGISENAIDFIKSLLVKDPKKRPTAKECLQHVWLKEDVDDLVGVNGNSNNGSFEVLPKVVIESNKENQSMEDDINNYIHINGNNNVNDVKVKDKNRDYFILKMTSHSNSSESKSVPNTPSCKRFMISEESSTLVRSASTERRNHSTSSEKSSSSSTILFESNSSITSFSSSTASYESPYHLVFREDIRDERVSFIY